MWNPTNSFLDPFALITNIFSQKYLDIQAQCTRHHWFTAFIVVFLNISFSYNALISKIDIINCQNNEATETYPFVPSIASKSTIAGNISVFEYLNIR